MNGIRLANLVGRSWALRRTVLQQLVDDVRSGQALNAVVERSRRPSTRRPGKGVGVLPIVGFIEHRPSLLGEIFGATALKDASTMLDELVADPDVGTIVLAIDSPGGTVDGVPEFAAQVRAARDRKPIVAVADTMAASAAYWIGAQASELVVSPSGMVGSIGVYWIHEDLSRALDAAGVTTTVIKAGKYKAEANPYEPIGEAREHIQEEVDDYYRQFVNDVAAGRGISPSLVRSGYGEGRALTAKPALKAGMVDRIATYDATIARAIAAPTKSARDMADLALYRARARARGHAAASTPVRPVRRQAARDLQFYLDRAAARRPSGTWPSGLDLLAPER